MEVGGNQICDVTIKSQQIYLHIMAAPEWGKSAMDLIYFNLNSKLNFIYQALFLLQNTSNYFS